MSNESKAVDVDNQQLLAVKDDYVRMSLELQRAFGLRREEAIKFSPSFADKGDHIVLKDSWTKGGQGKSDSSAHQYPARRNESSTSTCGKGSLIPGHKQYIQQLRTYERHTTQAGLSRLHGLRHAYAQQRYQTLTGWCSPAAGGPVSTQLSSQQSSKIIARA